jgi:N-acetylmuramic acid 6-phosphate etherase
MTEIEIAELITEKRNPESINFSELDTLSAVKLMNNQDESVAAAVRKTIPEIGQAIDALSERMSRGGRLIYVGAGSSGRYAQIDALECGPTFAMPNDRVFALLAGGQDAFDQSIEDAEDQGSSVEQELHALELAPEDCVVAVAASGRTPYAVSALNYANKVGSLTIAIANNPNSQIGQIAQIAIEVITGPEVLTGSTRLKAGTAQKMVMNILTTVTMSKLGKVRQNLMVDLVANNSKLRDRGVRIIVELTGVSAEVAQKELELANGHVKTALEHIAP